MDQPEQIQLPADLDQSGEAQRTRVWRHDQFVGLGFDLARAAIMADDARVDLAQARRLAKVARLRAEWKADSGRSDLR